MARPKAVWSARSRASARCRCSSSGSARRSTTCGRSSRASSPRRWLVSFSAVAKRYAGGEEALRGVSFAMEAGELVFITGRSGAGKSTLLKLIPAIERPSSGSVIVNGQNVGALKRAAIPYLRRNVGLVFQDQKLLYDRTVYDNVMLPLSFSAQPPKEAARRAHRRLEYARHRRRARAARGRLCAARKPALAHRAAYARAADLALSRRQTRRRRCARGAHQARSAGAGAALRAA